MVLLEGETENVIPLFGFGLSSPEAENADRKTPWILQVDSTDRRNPLLTLRSLLT
jgi:hypothetical protein